VYWSYAAWKGVLLPVFRSGRRWAGVQQRHAHDGAVALTIEKEAALAEMQVR